MRRLPAPFADLLLAAVDTPKTANRSAARQLVRQALQQLLAENLDGPQQLLEQPGQPLRLAPPHAGIGLSVSHEVGLSLLAIHFAGPVGIDLLGLQQLPSNPEEINRLAHDYLGQSLHTPASLAMAWTQHEAALKCLGKPLQEWQAGQATALAACQIHELALPAAYVGSVATLRAAENPAA